MLRKKITVIIIAIVSCILVMCAHIGKHHNNGAQNDTALYKGHRLHQTQSTPVLHNNVRNDAMQHNYKPSHQSPDTIVLSGIIKSIKGLYGESPILHSLSFVLIDKFKDFFTFIGEDDSLASDANWNDFDWRCSNLYSFDLWIDSVIAARPAVVDSLLFVVQNIKENEAVIKQIWNWCETFTVLVAGYNYGGYADTYPEILFDIPEMYPVTRLFIDTTMQDWASLSSSQVLYLPFEISNYLSTLPDKERLLFYKSLFERTYNKMEE